ncbi:amino acid ABC transporter substrate-binding protein [Paenibacillus selenitireducens]|uniref:Amino acid ABC transporter substrate-binding protein n=2 Tax=Paenibacillus selenitireducens TaxID=1324314 RepID=A0A1T2XJR0_9BACL|nr:amino acid ABC transporter substrate-binding protein [Paenibacillus selenitireducens]
MEGNRMKKLNLVIIFALLLTMAAGCGASKTSSPANTSNGSTVKADGDSGKKEAVKKIIVGTGTGFPNVCFINDKGELDGFDVELVKEIDKRLPEIEIEFKTMEFSNLLLSLETKKIDFVAHQMEKNPDREERYLFNNEPYNIFPNKITVHDTNESIHSIDDLKGKKVIVGATSAEAYIVEQYNKTHDDAIHIVYTKAGDDAVNQLKSGRVDATISTQFAVDFLNQSVKAEQKTVGEVLTNSKVFYILRKGDTELAGKLDKALQQIKADGTLGKLSEKWLGRDYSHETK